MNLNALLGPILSQMPQVQADMQIEVLREIPTETLYLALKNADADVVLWFFQNALPEQVQGLIDLDCWQGDRFLPDRFEAYFKSMVLLHPVKLAEYCKKLDSEVIVRTLMEYCDVVDFDPQEPPEVAEDRFMISPDSKYALLLKTDRPDLREMLYLWMNKLSSSDIELMRRHLESCKWEQPSDLEEFSYGIKKGRLEDMGFVDEHEALSLYAVGKAGELKKKLLQNPLPPDSKSKQQRFNEEDYLQISREFLPVSIEKPLFSDGFFYDTFKSLKDAPLKDVLLQEMIRVINTALSADHLIHATLDKIAAGSFRARRYVDLGLSYLSEGRLPEAADILRVTPIHEIYRVGWLVTQDIVHAESMLKKMIGAHFFGEIDDSFRAKLTGRHPTLTGEELRDLDLPTESLLTPQATLNIGARIASLFLLGTFFQKDLGKSLALQSDPIMGTRDSVFHRLLTALFREACGEEFQPTAIGFEEWPRLASAYRADRLAESFNLVRARVPADALSLFDLRMGELRGQLDAHWAHDGKKFPDTRFFRALRLKTKATA